MKIADARTRPSYRPWSFYKPSKVLVFLYTSLNPVLSPKKFGVCVVLISF
jgi:hypothetical protein